VANNFRRIGVGLDTRTLRRRDLNAMWNYIMVWAYPNRLDFLTSVLGATRREFTDVIGSICRTYPIHIWNHLRPGKDYFSYILKDQRYLQLTHIGWRAQWRLRYVIYFSARESVPARILLKALDTLLRFVRIF
jgi:hypothetical protein